MRNLLFVILILLLVAMGFGYYQYLLQQNNESITVEEIVNNIVNTEQEEKLTPGDIVSYPMQTSAARLTLVENGQINGMSTKATDGVTFFTLDLYSDLPDPEENKKYSAWLTGGVAPDAYFYLGDLDKSEDNYQVNYATGDVYEGMLSFNKVLVSLENKENDLIKPSFYILEGNFNQQ